VFLLQEDHNFGGAVRAGWDRGVGPNVNAAAIQSALRGEQLGQPTVVTAAYAA
jgi:hypothetical protein